MNRFTRTRVHWKWLQIIPNPNRAVAKKCPECGDVTYPSTRFCSRCGHVYTTKFNRDITVGFFPDDVPQLPQGSDPSNYTPLAPGHEPQVERSSWFAEFTLWTMAFLAAIYGLGPLLMALSTQ